MNKVYVDPDIATHLRTTIGEFLASATIGGEDRYIRVVKGDGRMRDADTLRDMSWEDTFGDYLHYPNTITEHDAADAQENGITINVYGSINSPDRTADVDTFPYEELYPARRYVNEPVYDCIVTNDDGDAERFWEFPNEEYVNWGGEYAHRCISFLIPLTGIIFREGIDVPAIFDGALEACLDPTWAEDAIERRETRNRERFVAIGRERDDGELRNVRTRIDENVRNLAEAQEQEEIARQALREAQELLDAILGRREAGGTTPEALLTEYEAVLRNVKVHAVRWSGSNRLIVRTEDLELTHPRTGDTTIVGKFDLTFDFRDQTINAHNLTNRRGSYDHPHVHNGSFCQGELAPTLIRLMNQRQIGAAVNMALAALEYANMDDDWGRHVEWWFGAVDAPEAVRELPADE